MRQRQTQRQQTCGCQGEVGWEKDALGVWDEWMKTVIHRGDTQQGLTVYSTENYTQHPVINCNGGEYEKTDNCITFPYSRNTV